MKTPLLALAALLLALPAAAQDYRDRDLSKSFSELADAALARFRTANAREAAVESTLVAMNDGPEVGGTIHDYIKAKAVKITFLDSVARSSHVPKIDNSHVKIRAEIFLPGAAPLYPRVLGAMLARETAVMMLEGMPDCAEYRYMWISLQVRSWLELGGDKSALPVMETLAPAYKDERASADYKLWLGTDSQTALERIGQAAGVSSIPELEGKAKDDVERASWDAANKRFVTFLLAENEWRRSNGYLLK